MATILDRRSGGGLVVWIVLLASSLVMATLGTANAAFSGSSGSTAALASDTLDPPTRLAADTSTTDEVTLTWTPSIDGYADGYQIWRSETSGSGYTQLATVAGQASTSYVDDLCASATCGTALAFGGVGGQVIIDNDTTSVTLAVPPGTVAGDFLVAHVVIDDEYNGFTTPSGWTLVLGVGSGGASEVTMGVFYRIATGTEAASYTFSWPGDQNAVAAMLRYTGVDTSAPIQTQQVAVGDSDLAVAPSVTTTRDGSWALRFYAGDDDLIDANSTPTGHDRRYGLETNDIGDVSGILADRPQPTAGATGTASFQLTKGENWIASTMILQASSTISSTYYYVVRATAGTWVSSYSNEAS